jgi:spoIIIJ-associated protein
MAVLKSIQLYVDDMEQAKTEAVKQLGIQESKLEFKLVKSTKNLLTDKEAIIVDVTPKVNLALLGREYLCSILDPFNIEYKMEMTNDEDEISYSIQTEENSLFIGQAGKTLRSLQLLLKNYLGSFVVGNLNVVLDIGGYKEFRKKQLEILATKVAKDVIQSKQDVTLDPLSSYERLIIHQKLAEWRDVYTQSEGEGAERRLIVKYRKK